MILPPKDFHDNDRTGAVRLARVFSNLVSPPTMFPALVLAIALQLKPLRVALEWWAAYGITVSLLPILFVLYLLKTGRIAELHMSNTRERLLPYAVAVVSASVLYIIERFAGAPAIIADITLFNALELAALGLITTRWLISMHSAATTAVATILWLVWGPFWSLLVGIPLIASVAFVRLFLRRHTPAQIVAGWLLGIGLPLGMSYLGYFA